MDRKQQEQAPSAENGGRTIEDINREAAAARAASRQGIEWIEDRRSRPRRTKLELAGRPR